MSLDKAIDSGKEKRRHYRGAKAVSMMCRRNDCPYCYGNATHKNRRRKPIVYDEEISVEAAKNEVNITPTDENE